MFKKLPPSETLFNLIRCILICHDVLKINDKLSGASQDELVLMQMIEDNYDSSFISRDSDSITIEVNKVKEVYDIIKFYEFTSERKMMSITVKR
jgi:magnesium-transporting ATPase (P-type)